MTLDEFLIEEGMTAKAFAELAKTSEPHLSRIRRGTTRPSWELAKRISQLTRGRITASSLMEVAAEGGETTNGILGPVCEGSGQGLAVKVTDRIGPEDSPVAAPSTEVSQSARDASSDKIEEFMR
ncbi:MAG: helix-turn-helix transcriptional regulator [Roseibium sp.]|nr:helix-turn-helix transcriptional regulator [Roseibium sp.]